MIDLKDHRIIIAIALIVISIAIIGFLMYQRKQKGSSAKKGGLPSSSNDGEGEDPDPVAELADEIMELQEET